MAKDRSKLQKLIETSTLLAPAEREYWLRNLPDMADKQCRRLQSILDVPDEFPFEPQFEAFFQDLGKAAAAALKQGQNPLAA